MFRSARTRLYVLGILLFAVPLAGFSATSGDPGPAGKSRPGESPATPGRPEVPDPPDDGGLERHLAQQLARLDDRMGLGTLPNASPLWLARAAAVSDHLAGLSGGGELPGESLLRRLAADLRRLGLDRGLGGPPEEPGRAPSAPGKERAEHLRRLRETIRLLHHKLDQDEGGGSSQDPFAPRAAPANDDCASAQAITSGTFTGSTSQATNDGTATCGASSTSPDVWYVFTAPAAGIYGFDTFGSSYDTVLSLRTGCAGGSETGCNDDADGTLQSKLGRAMAAGESVWVRVSGFSGARGAYTLNVSQVGGISGAVTRRDTGGPLEGVQVVVYDSSGWYTTETTTSPDGSYGLALSPGTYYLRASRAGFIGELYDAIPCPFYGSCWPEDGSPVLVGSGITGGIDFDLAPAASLSGTVTDTVTTDPLAGYIYLYGASGSFLGSFFTDSGTFEVTGLPSGKYYLQAEVLNYRSELYDDIPCGSSCSPSSGTQIDVTEGGALTGIDFALDRNPSIEGTLTEEGSGDPITGQRVLLHGSTGSWLDGTWTSIDGSYRFQGLEPGSYFIRTDTTYHRDELYDGIPCEPFCTVSAGTTVEAVLGSATTGIDFVLAPFGKVAGTVIEAGTGTPLGGKDIRAYGPTGSFIGSTRTSSDGRYELPGLPTGTYFVATATETHANEVYDDMPCEPCEITAGTPITTADGSTTPGIDFALRRRGSITGRVTQAIGGAPLAGTDVAVYYSSGHFLYATSTVSDGTYELGNLAGSYYIRTNSYQFQNEVYDDIPCLGFCDVTVGTLVAVEPETTTSGVDFALDRLGFVEGSITTVDAGPPLDSNVQVIEPDGDIVAWVSAPQGNFRIDGLPPGSYYVKTESYSAHQDELFDDVPCEPDCDFSLGTLLPVQPNGGVLGVNFVLNFCLFFSYQDLVSTYINYTHEFSACQRVSAIDVTVAPGANVTFKAGRTVVLGDGFRVEQGASFRAVIEPAWADD